MGSDIFTESAVAIELSDFLNVDAIKKKGTRELIANVFYLDKFISDKAFADMVKSKSLFIETFIKNMSMYEGRENDVVNNAIMLEVFCEHTGLNIKALPDYKLQSFDNCRESGYDIVTGVIYIMFDSFNLFETVMTNKGKKVAKILGVDHIHETTWTVHSY